MLLTISIYLSFALLLVRQHLADRRQRRIERLVESVYKETLSLHSKIQKLMNAAADLGALVDQLTESQASLKTSLDSIKTGVATIVANIP